MAQVPDTRAIEHLIRRARVRIRMQWALDGAVTATVLAAAGAMVSIFLVRVQWVTPEVGIDLLALSGAIVIVGAVWAALRKLDDEAVARRIDRASNLSDRLSTAIAFARDLAAGKRPSPADGDDHVTEDMMRAAIKDGVRAVPRANLRAATPFAVPRDARAAIGFLAVAALAAGLALPSHDLPPIVYRANPAFAPPGADVAIEGAHLTTGVSMPAGAAVALGTAKSSRGVTITEWVPDEIHVHIPADAVLGKQQLIVFAGGAELGAVDFTVVDPSDPRFHRPGSVALDPDERQYVESLLRELHEAALRDQVPELDEFAKKIEQLLKQAERGEISKEQLLDALQKAEDELGKNGEAKQPEVDKKLEDMGKELSKDPMTKELGDALQKQDLKKAQDELEKLADKLDQKQLDQKQKDELAKQLDQVSKEMDKQDKQDEQKQQQQQQKVEDEIRQLEQKQKQAKTEQQKQETARQLEDKQRELKKLQQDQQQQQESEQRRAVKRLQQDMEKAAENMQPKPEKGDQQQQQDQQSQEEKEKQASRNLHDAARETGRVDHDKRKQATQKKMSSQMDDLREAMRRAKQKGSKGPQDPFNRDGKNQDFSQRAGGGKGLGGANWKPGQPGQGQGQGQGNGQGHGSGQGQGGDDWGTGHEETLTGDSTQKSGNDKDQDLQGQSSANGGSTRETILAAAQKGFASVGYKKVYADYQRVIENVMTTEKLPASYKYYVKRYFAKIHPNMVEEK